MRTMTINQVGYINWMAKIRLVLIACMVFSIFMYEGFYQPQNVQAAVAVRSVGAIANSGNAITPAMPAGVLTNDILLLFLETADQAITVAGGTETWAQVPGSPVTGATGTRLTVFWARASQNTPTSPTTSDSGDHQAGRIIAFSGVITSGNPWDVVGTNFENTSDTSVAISGVTTRVPNTMIVAAMAGDLPDATGNTNFSAWASTSFPAVTVTEQIDNTVVSGNGGALGVATWTMATAGATGPTTATLANAAVKAMMTIALMPPLTVTINQAVGQPDPAGTSPINFTVVFSDPVSDFATGDVTITGTAGGTKTATVTGSGTTYNVAVTGMTTNGTVIATIASGVATNAAGGPNTASTSTDNTVTFNDVTSPSVTINQAVGQADPTTILPISFKIVFSEPINPATFTGSDVTITGTAGGSINVVLSTTDNITWTAYVSGLTSSGTVIANIAAGVVSDLVGNLNTISTSTDNTVTFNYVAQNVTCSNPGLDGPATPSGVINAYYPGIGTASAGSTLIVVNAVDTTEGGVSLPISAGDLLLIMQMQDADSNWTNTSSYGGSQAGTGYTALNNAGVYEYVVAASAVPVAGGTISLASPLANTYRTANYLAGTSGQRRFQVIRVPQYASAVLAGNIQTARWNGNTGGIVAFDVAGELNWNGRTIDASGRGFRGGGGRGLTGAVGGYLYTDTRTPATNNVNASKGEGIAGTPRYMFIPTTPGDNSAGVNLDTGIEGYPNGSHGRGAPGNAGGGATDGNPAGTYPGAAVFPAGNDMNTGGGGGGAYSIGGMGGYAWTPGIPPGPQGGGYGGYSVPMAPGLLTMGGGGGSGSTNNSTGTPVAGLASSGAAGGGIVIVRTRTVTVGSTGTINANGTNANSTITNDASGGGGGGGAVLVFATNSGLGTLTVNANGGNGGSNTGGGSPHGPGGGGSGGFVALSTSTSVTINVAAGVNGTTAGSATSTPPYGSTASAGGYQIYTLQPTDAPGVSPNALCFPQLTVTKETSKAETVQGDNTSYTITVANTAGYGTATGVTLSDVLPGLPTPFTYSSTSGVTLNGGATRPSTTNPVAPTTTPAWSSFSIPGGGSVSIDFIAAIPAGATTGTYQNPATVTYDDPTRTSAGQTVTPGGTYQGGGPVPGSNYDSASTTLEDVTIRQPATFTKSFVPASIAPGGTSVLTITVSNPNALTLANAGFTDIYPAGLTNAATPNGNTTCGAGTVTAVAGGGSVALSGATIPASGSCTVTVNVTFAIAGNYTNTIPAGALTNNHNVTNIAPASATLNQAPIQPPSAVKTFSPAQIQQGGNTTLSITLTNGGTTNLTGVAFTDTLTNMQVAAVPSVTNTCGGVVTAVAGTGSISLAGGAINAGVSCAITVQVTSNTLSGVGGHPNTVTGLTSTQSGAGPNSNTAYLVVGATPTISKAFGTSPISAGGTSVITFTIGNTGNIPLTGATFTDTLTSMWINAAGAAGGTCAGAGGNSFGAGQTGLLTFSGITIPASSNCTITITVTSNIPGSHPNTASGVSTDQSPVPGSSSNTANLAVLYPPDIAKSFSPGTIQTGSTSTLTLTLTNLNSATQLTGVAFSDTLTNMQINANGAAGGTCVGAGSNSFTAGQTSLSFSGITINANSSCTVTVVVTSSSISPLGGHLNVTSGATSTQTPVAGSPSNDAYLTVLGAPTIAKSFSPSAIVSGGTSVLTFTLTNPNPTALSGGSFTDTFPAAPGQMRLTNVAQTYIGGGRGTCTGAIPSANGAGNQLTAITISAINIPANGSCTIMVDVTAATNGNYSNTTTGVTTSQTPTAGTVSNTATLTVGSIGISKAFSPSPVGLGDTSTISFVLTNQSGANRSNVAFSDTYPANMVNATPPSVVGNCNGGAVTAAAGAGTFSLSGGQLNSGASCTITVNVTTTATGTFNNTTTGVSATGITTGAVSNTATLTVLAKPTITVEFIPSTIFVSGTSIMRFTLSNPNAAQFTNANFTDTLTGFNVSNTVIGGTCDSVTNSPALVVGATSLNLTVPVLLSGSCTIDIIVTSSVAGVYPTTTSVVTTTQTAGTTTGSDTLTVIVPTLVTLSDFSAYNENNRFVVQWTTSSEIDTAGFYLFRLDETSGRYRQINRDLLPALLTSQQGGTYSLIDNGASLTRSNTYLLTEIEGRGRKNTYGPFTVTAGAGNAVENHYISAPKAAEAFLKPDSSSSTQPKVITKYIDPEGTIVIAGNSRSSHAPESLVTHEVSDYTRTPKSVTAAKKAALNVRAGAKVAASLITKQKTGSKVKITIDKDGLYFLDSAEISSLLGLAEAKVRQMIRSAKLALTNQGSTIAYIPAEDLSGLFFYGQGIDSLYTKENIYWLSSAKGELMASLQGTGPAPSDYSTFTETIHAEEDKTVAPVLANGPNSDYWFWDYVIAGNLSLGTKHFNIQAFGVADTASSAGLTATLHGVTATGVTNEHHVRISLNGTVIGEESWKGTDEHLVNLNFSQTLLSEGTNTIEVKGLLDPGVPYSIFFVDSFDLTYQRLLAAHEDSLTFSATGNQPLTVHGFTKPDLFVFDITNPGRPVMNTATTIDGSSGNYSVSFVPSPGSRYLAIASDAAGSVAHASADSPSTLTSTKNMADYIIITTKELAAAAQELANYRQGQGLKSMVVDLKDIMDEFNYGISNPEAIRSFLSYAKTRWKKGPKYVLLAGDGTYDYKDNMGIGDNLVPTLMAETPEVISPSDNLYADFDGDHVPDIAIGRIPALTAQELRSVIAKIIAYESTAGSRVVMLADNPDNGGKFPADSDDIAAFVPGTYSVSKIYLSEYTLSQARQLLFNEIQTGAVLINYTGHAGMDLLANEGLLKVSDMTSLQNIGKPFVLAAMTCTVGNFALPGFDSLSEALVTKDGAGAVAVWAPTGLSYNYLSKGLDEQFFLGGLGHRGVALGDVILGAFRNYQAAGRPAYIMDIFNLQGDPALRLW